MQTKSIFRSRTALLNLIVAIVGAFACFSDDTADAVKAAAVPVMTLLGLANVALRRVTKDAVTILPDKEPDYFDDLHGM